MLTALVYKFAACRERMKYFYKQTKKKQVGTPRFFFCDRSGWFLCQAKPSAHLAVVCCWCRLVNNFSSPWFVQYVISLFIFETPPASSLSNGYRGMLPLKSGTYLQISDVAKCVQLYKGDSAYSVIFISQTLLWLRLSIYLKPELIVSLLLLFFPFFFGFLFK